MYILVAIYMYMYVHVGPSLIWSPGAISFKLLQYGILSQSSIKITHLKKYVISTLAIIKKTEE